MPPPQKVAIRFTYEIQLLTQRRLLQLLWRANVIVQVCLAATGLFAVHGLEISELNPSVDAGAGIDLVSRTGRSGRPKLPHQRSFAGAESERDSTFQAAFLNSGTAHTCAILDTHETYCWGANWAGQLGASTGFSNVPVPVESDRGFTMVSAGHSHTCGIDEKGRGYCWGNGVYGQLGNGKSGDGASSRVPVAVQTDLALSSIAASGNHSCAITTDGDLICWGQGRFGQLGNGSNDDSSSPIPVLSRDRFASVSVGFYQSCAVTDHGKLYCWGASWGPVPVLLAAEVLFTSISVGKGDSDAHACAVAVDGMLYCWGSGLAGKLGNGELGELSLPTAVAEELRFSVVSTGANHTCGIAHAGTAYCWGSNWRGQLGNTTSPDQCPEIYEGGELPCSKTPVPVSGKRRYTAISAGAWHTCAMTSDGAVYCWGSNGAGQLGSRLPVGEHVSVAIPTPLAGSKLPEQ